MTLQEAMAAEYLKVYCCIRMGTLISVNGVGAVMPHAQRSTHHWFLLEKMMKRLLVLVTSFALALGLTADSAAAQLAGNPVYAVMPGAGVTISGDFGHGLNDSARTYFAGGRLAVQLPAVSFWVSGGAYDARIPGEDWEIAVGGGVAVNILKSPSLPVALSLQAGGGTVPCGSGCTVINAVAGPALKVNVVGAVNTFQPWLMPRVQVTRFSMSGASVNQLGFGGSGGVNINLPSGLGLHAVVDYAMFEETISGAMLAEKRSPLTVGGGLHYSWSIPGFGVL